MEKTLLEITKEETTNYIDVCWLRGVFQCIYPSSNLVSEA